MSKLKSIGLWRDEVEENEEAAENEESKASDAPSFLTPETGVRKLRGHSITEILADLHLNKDDIKHRF